MLLAEGLYVTSSADTLSSPVRTSRGVVVLGSTGSIGVNTLDVIQALSERFHIVGLVAHTRWQRLAEQCHRFQARYAVITDPSVKEQAERSQFPQSTELWHGIEAACRLASLDEVDIVVSAVVGAAGLHATWAALQAGKTVALANKETLVVAGPLVMDLARSNGAVLLPVDSEHSAILQAISGHSLQHVARIVLTASGGPFRGRTAPELEHVQPQDALKHPTWQMGPKITIDSATLMNKALEVIEARWLFDLSPSQIDVILHPESIVHSFVEFVDGSVLAQLSPPDMRLPIQYALTYPERLPGPAHSLDWQSLRQLRFENPDRSTFKALDLGFEVAQRGGTCGVVLNAANEVAVNRFLAGDIGFLDIVRGCQAVLSAHNYEPSPTLDRLLCLDQWARQEMSQWCRKDKPRLS